MIGESERKSLPVMSGEDAVKTAADLTIEENVLKKILQEKIM